MQTYNSAFPPDPTLIEDDDGAIDEPWPPDLEDGAGADRDTGVDDDPDDDDG